MLQPACNLAKIDIFTDWGNSNRIDNKGQEQKLLLLLPFISFGRMKLLLTAVLLCTQAVGLLGEGNEIVLLLH